MTTIRKRVTVRTIGDELRKQFGCRVHKLPVHAAMTCPNRDGTLGSGGCTYCGPSGSAAAWTDPDQPVAGQITAGMAFARSRFHASKFIAYFQPFTNTYAPVRTLKSLWDDILEFPDIVGLSVGTRPDCLPNPALDLFRSYQERLPYLCLEIGLQSAHDKTLNRVHRGHDFACFEDAVSRAQARGIPICVHVILGLPGESEQEMMETVQAVLDMGIQGIKLHHLHIIKGAPMEQEYLQGNVQLLEMEEYVRLVCGILDLISGRMVVHRFMGEAPGDLLVAPSWTRRKGEVLTAIYRESGLCVQ